MRIALVIDPERWAVDAGAFDRLAVALASEGEQVIRITPPRDADAPESRLIPVHALNFDGSMLFRRSRLGVLSSALEERAPEVFVSFGPRAFAASAELAADLGAALIAMISTDDELARTPLRRHLRLLDAVGVSTAPLAGRAERSSAPELVQMLPLGVALPRAPAAAPPSVAIAGSGRDVGAYRALFAALADVASALPDLQVAIEFPPGHDSRLWGMARQFKIQHLLNGVVRLEQVRSLVLQCAVMAVPEPVRGTRTMVLEAMAAGRTIVAMEDAMAHYLIDGVTALVAQEREEAEWTALLTRALLQPDSCLAIRAEASARVGAMYGSSRCATQLLSACTAAVRGPAIAFTGPASP